MNTEMNQDEDNVDNGDFGDFQTCNTTSNTTLTNADNAASLLTIDPAIKNIFELDWFRFKQYRSDFQIKLADYFNDGTGLLDDNANGNTDNDSDNHILSHEQIINHCPIWDQLCRSFNRKPALQFQKSNTFKRFSECSLKHDNNIHKKQELNADHNDNDDSDNLPVNTRRRNQAGDEEDIANDLDMHSLIIGSFQETNSGKNAAGSDSDQLTVDADQVIKEIESLYSNQSTPNKMCRTKPNDPSTAGTVNSSKHDPLLSLNASSLLDAALKTWQMQQTGTGTGITMFHHNMMVDDQDDDDEDGYPGQFHSLPADLNNEQFFITTNLSNNNQTAAANEPASFKPSNNNCPAAVAERKPETHSANRNEQAQQNDLLDKLNQLSIVQLNELYMELEQIIQIRSEVLIQELALRDELEFEKEQKNTFISLLLSVQNKRRHYTSSSSVRRNHHHHAHHNKKCSTNHHAHHQNNHHRNLHRRNSNDSMMSRGSSGAKGGSARSGGGLMSLALDLSTSLGTSIRESIMPSSAMSGGSKPSSTVYLTTVIPYTNSMIPIDLQTLQILNKLLKALNEDSPTVPALLTDYILKVICP